MLKFFYINNQLAQRVKLYPPMYLVPEEIQIEGRIVLHIYVPVETQVCRHNGKIFDRSHEADLDITNNSDAVYQLYARKQDSYYVNKVTGFDISDLRSDLIDRARKMSRIRNMNHACSNSFVWKGYNDYVSTSTA